MNYKNSLQAQLIISASDRIDVLLASSLATSNGIPLAGLVLTEHHEPNPLVLEFCQSAIKNGLPILHTPLSTFETAQQLANLSNEIPVDDTERADQVTRFVSSHIDPEWLTQMLNGDYKPRLSLLHSVMNWYKNRLLQKTYCTA